MSGAPTVEVTATTYTCGCHIATTEAGYVAEVEYCGEGRLLAARLHRSRLNRRPLPFESVGLMDALREVERHEKTLQRHRLFAGALTVLRRASDPARLSKDGFPRPPDGVRLAASTPDGPLTVLFTLKVPTGASRGRTVAEKVREAGFEVPIATTASIYPLVPVTGTEEAPSVLLDALRRTHGTDLGLGELGAPAIEILSQEAASFWAFALGEAEAPERSRAGAEAGAERSA